MRIVLLITLILSSKNILSGEGTSGGGPRGIVKYVQVESASSDAHFYVSVKKKGSRWKTGHVLIDSAQIEYIQLKNGAIINIDDLNRRINNVLPYCGEKSKLILP